MSRRRPARATAKTAIRDRANEGPEHLPVGRQYVAVRIRCPRCHRRLLEVGRDTFDGASTELWCKVLHKAVQLDVDDHHGPDGKLCPRCPCGGTPQARRDKLEEALALLWQPHRHQVFDLTL